MRLRLLALAAATALLSGCAANTSYELPPDGGTPDYQLGVSYDIPASVTIVARDRTADAAKGVYSICYVNGFQTQPGKDWDDGLLLHNDAGAPITDPNWPDEVLLDTSTSAKRAAIAERIGEQIRACAQKGFDAVEFDNLDSHLRSEGRLEFDDNLALARELVTAAHNAGLAAAQKNSSESSQRLRDEAGFDFVVAEECAVFDECDAYREVYGEHVIDIEYSDTDLDFAQACAEGVLPASAALRDRLLTGPDDPEYVFATCG